MEDKQQKDTQVKEEELNDVSGAGVIIDEKTIEKYKEEIIKRKNR